MHIQKACRAKEKPHPEDAGGLDITGRYEEAQRFPQFTCQINQAGTHVEGWIQFVYIAAEGKKLSDKIKSLPRLYTISGDLNRTNRQFIISIFDDCTKDKGIKVGQGFIKSLDKDRLAISGSLNHPQTGIPTSFQTSMKVYPIGADRPRLSEYAIMSLPESIRQDISAHETAPLPTPYINQIKRAFAPGHIREIIDKWNAQAKKTEDWRYRNQKDLIDSFHDYTKNFFDRFHPELWRTVAWHIRYLLSCYKYDNSSTCSLLRDLERIITHTYAKCDYTYFGKSGLNLNWIPSSQGQLYKYKVDLALFGTTLDPIVVAGAGFLKGTLTIKKTLIKDNENKQLVSKFKIALNAISIGANVKWSFNAASWNSGETFTSEDWQNADFPGDVVMFDAGIWVSLGGGFSLGYTKLRIYGNRTHPPIEFDLSGLSPNLGFGAGLGAIALFGEINRHDGGKIRSIMPGELDIAVFALDTSPTTSSHFELGCSVLNREGRDQIRKFCCKELFYLQSPYGILQIDGHTDTIDSMKRNEELSSLRIQNVMQAIRDSLGKKLAIHQKNIILNPYGEKKAVEEGRLRDGVKDPKWRKVEVFLNSRGMIKLVEK